MSRLVIASNRVADINKSAQSGGLAVAVGEAMRDTSGLWFGWSGEVVPDGHPVGLQLDRAGTVGLATQPLTESEHAAYYLGYANAVLWPVFHYRLDLAEFDQDALEGYRAVNARFARALAALIDADDVVWIHDYHLIPLGAALRALGVENRIGFFLHIPFPPPEVISAVPDHEWLIDSLYAYDLVGFQTDRDVDNFERASTDIAAGLDPASCPHRTSARETEVDAFPIGIDAENFRAMARTPEADGRIRRLTRGDIRNHIIGVDRLDYSKGLPDRFRAFRRYLELYPAHRKTTVLMQIAPPTRSGVSAYDEIRTELEQLSGAINGAYGDFDWTPVRYIHRAVPRETLAALFRGSKVGMVTPLRDGMNLVAKEYVAAQNDEDPGVLVLSQFAGAAATMTDALIVNPYDADEVAQALHRAVVMPLDERLERHRRLLADVRENDVSHWWQGFLARLRAAPRR